MSTVAQLKKAKEEICALGNVYGSDIPVQKANKCIDLIRIYTRLDGRKRKHLGNVNDCMYAVSALFILKVQGIKIKDRLETLYENKDKLPPKALPFISKKIQSLKK